MGNGPELVAQNGQFVFFKMSYTYADFLAAINWLVAEGYIERFYDSDGSECVRICEGAEDCEV